MKKEKAEKYEKISFKHSTNERFLSSLGLASSDVTYDFSHITLQVAPHVSLSNYSNYQMAIVAHVSGYPSAGWEGVSIADPSHGTYVKNEIIAGATENVLNVGLTNNDAGSFLPVVTPADCLVQLSNDQILHVYGTLVVPGQGQAPQLNDLHCSVSY